MQALSVLSQISALFRHADECHLGSFENLAKPFKTTLAYVLETGHPNFEGELVSGCAEVSVPKIVTPMTSTVRNLGLQLRACQSYTGGPPPLNQFNFISPPTSRGQGNV